jgi:hypothetical protein
MHDALYIIERRQSNRKHKSRPSARKLIFRFLSFVNNVPSVFPGGDDNTAMSLDFNAAIDQLNQRIYLPGKSKSKEQSTAASKKLTPTAPLSFNEPIII